MIYCSVCGKYSPDGSPRCIHCGATDPSNPVTAEPMPMQQPVAPPPVYPSSSPAKQGGLFGEFQPKVGSFIGFFLAWCVPILNLVMFFKLGFGKNAPPLKKAYVRAVLVLGLILGGVSLILSILFAFTATQGLNAFRKLFTAPVSC